jgi:dipeptidyl-peptidase-3
MKNYIINYLLFTLCFLSACNSPKNTTEDFNYFSEQFADVKILRYQVPGFDNLNLDQKKLVYYLTQAGLEGRDIMYDQNYRHNISIRKALENIYINYNGDKSINDWTLFETYLKRIWFSNGIHHHYSNDKHKPGFSINYLKSLLDETNTTLENEAIDVIFNELDNKKVNLEASKGLIKGSAVNFYGSDVTAEDVDFYYGEIKKVPNPKKPISLGLNSKLVKEDGKLVEKVWKLNGMYSDEIEKIIYWLNKAVEFAENDKQKHGLELLIKYYETGDLNIWDEYNVVWVETKEGDVDYINGFIEVYNDPKGYRGSYESVVQIKDFAMSKKMDAVSNNAQWFEDNSPILNEHKKEKVVGISYNTVNVAGEAGDASPSTPIGINLPNANWIRAEHGSKSISLGNILYAYGNAGSSGRLNEFAFSKKEIELEKKYGEDAGSLSTALHEVIGHASGKINDGIGTPKETLKSYASALEEARADLVGLYYISDIKLEEIGISPSATDMGRASYDGYIRNGLITQLIRIKLGNDIEESHMRNRQLVSAWAYEKGLEDNVIEKLKKDNKTFYVINDYNKLRVLFGDLLREIQRIKSEGDYEAGKYLIENYGVKVDQELHKEVLERNKKFTSAPYSGFINPELILVKNKDGEVTDVKIIQPESFASQMLNYSKTY